MRLTLLFLTLCSATGFAQDEAPADAGVTPPPEQPENPEAGGYSAGPSKPPPVYGTTVHGSPEYTQDRTFAGTRFWLLDPGNIELELWVDDKFKNDGINDGKLKLEIEIGLVPHLQLDVYQNFGFGTDGWSVAGNQIELRIAFGSYYNQIPLNPVLYLEWAPTKGQDRAEVRLLLGGNLGDRFLWAANLFGEMNVDYFNAAGSEGLDAEAGITAAASYAVAPGILRLGLEAQGGVDMHGEKTLYPSALIGPNVLLTVRPAHLKLTATALIGIMPQDPRMRLFVIAGYAF